MISLSSFCILASASASAIFSALFSAAESCSFFNSSTDLLPLDASALIASVRALINASELNSISGTMSANLDLESIE